MVARPCNVQVLRTDSLISFCRIGVSYSQKQFFQRKSLANLKRGKKACSVLALSLLLLEPVRALAQSEGEQPSAETPAQSVEVEIHPLSSVLTAMNIPARGVLCGLTGLMAGIVMAASAGMRYADAAKMMEEGCSGPWIITPEMLEKSQEKEKKEAGSSIPGGDMLLRREQSFPPAAAP